MATYARRRHALAVSNGTDALEVAMRLLHLGSGDEVLVSSLSYIATVNCIVRCGAVPVFCDVDPTTLNIDPVDVAARVGPRSRALIVADYCGFAVDYDRLVPICETHGIELVVDGAQSIGTFHDERPALSFGRIATTSFHSAKIITTGEGGMVLFDEDAIVETAQRYRGQGEIPGRKYIHDTLGFNHRITDIQGAIGCVQMDKLEGLHAARSRHGARYHRSLADVDGVELVRPLPGTTPAWFTLPILVEDRDGLARYLRGLGIETRSLYPVPTYRQPIPEYPTPVEPRPNAEVAAARVINVPLFAQMIDDEIDEVAEAVRAFVESG
jgi:perosamine synthetase